MKERDRKERDDAETARQANKKRKRCNDDRRGDENPRVLLGPKRAKDGNCRDKHRDIVDRGIRNKDRKQREDVGRDKRCLEDKYREGNKSRVRTRNKCGFEGMRDEVGLQKVVIKKEELRVLVVRMV